MPRLCTLVEPGDLPRRPLTLTGSRWRPRDLGVVGPGHAPCSERRASRGRAWGTVGPLDKKQAALWHAKALGEGLQEVGREPVGAGRSIPAPGAASAKALGKGWALWAGCPWSWSGVRGWDTRS